jgi:glyoxylase-like metal-dependent hydrolase (beta-lactamase superfamily II)
MVLSHRDDVADHARFHERFHCPRAMHRADLAEGTAGIERPLDGDDPVQLAPDLLFIPTPGHTAGSGCLLYRNKFLFSGDPLGWNPERRMLSASKSYCWHDWPAQLRSLERLLGYDFTWVLPGHGASHRSGTPRSMREDLEEAIAYLKRC